MRLHCLVAVLVTLVLIDVGDGHGYPRYNRQQRIIKKCLKSPLVKEIVTRFICPKPDPCATVDCNCNGKCVDGTCQCETGFQGEFCTDIDFCAGDPCGANGECTDGVNMFSCTCNEGFTGDTCEIDIDNCAGDPCGVNGEECTDGVNMFSCTCNEGFTGDTCEIDIDNCAGDPCGANGECTDGVNMFSCICNEGFTGDTCETESETCTFTRFQDTITVGSGTFKGVFSLEACEQLCLDDDDCEASYRDPPICYFAEGRETETKAGSVYSLKICSGDTR